MATITLATAGTNLQVIQTIYAHCNFMQGLITFGAQNLQKTFKICR